ncbi:MAG: ylxH [Firmicutes bacterium]|nr:ylxH [Bacillota bacterium]
MRDQAEKLRQMVKNSIRDSTSGNIIKCQTSKTRVITVTSGKGGVGKTNFTVNLALSLANAAQKVLLIDADLGMANVDVVLGYSTKYNMLNLLEDNISLPDVVTDGPRGIKFMSGGSGIYELANLSHHQLQHIIKQVTLFDSWADFILVDTGAGINRNVLNFVMAADEVIVITTPEPTAITDAYAMIKAYASNHGTAPVNLVINRVLDNEEGQNVVDKLTKVSSRFLGQQVKSLGVVYEDRNMRQAVKQQTPLILSFPDTISARCIDNIAHLILYGNPVAKPRGIRGFFHRFLDMKW